MFFFSKSLPDRKYAKRIMRNESFIMYTLHATLYVIITYVLKVYDVTQAPTFQPSYQHFKGQLPVGTGDYAEKRLKKQSTWGLGNSLIEGSSIVESNQFLQETLHSCGETLVCYLLYIYCL